MARYYWSKKYTVEDYPKTLSIFSFKRDKFLEKWKLHNIGTSAWSRNGEQFSKIWIEVNRNEYEGTLRVFFTQTDRNTQEKKDFDYIIQMTTTECHIWGGRRWWFICPCRGDRCAKLYLQDNGYFASRKTLWLSYESKNKSRYWRYLDSVFGPNEEDLSTLYASIKYQYRNWKPTRKMKRYLKMSYSPYTGEQIMRMEEELFNSWRRNMKWN